MKKRRTIVYVRPGKDVTLYVPAETPPEVIDYLNHLKQEGTFSQGVMEIVTRHVQHQQAAVPFTAPDTPGTSFGPVLSDEVTASDSFRDQVSTKHLEAGTTAPKEEDYVQHTQAAPDSGIRKKLNLAQIFRQAQHNSGKMIDSRENK